MNYQSYKGRLLNLDKPVKVYKNLHNGLLSVKQGNLVICHVFNIVLDNVSFIVYETGRQKVIQTRQKNVHAFIVGYVKHINVDNASINTSIISKNLHNSFSYNPYKHNYFYMKHDHSKVMLYCNSQVLVDSKIGCFIIK